MADPAKLVAAQTAFMQQSMALWEATLKRMQGEEVAPLVEPERGDRRFKDPAWAEDLVFDYLKQSYLLASRWVQGVCHDVEGLDPKIQEKVDFYTRQFVSASSPSNFAFTNPQVLRKAKETGGENLVNGLKNLMGDLEKGKGRLKISMTDAEAFEVGKNVAVTPGKVIYPERAHAAHPVRSFHRDGTQAADGDRAALDQQILRHGPAAQEQPDQVDRRSGLHALCRVLG